MGFLDNDNTSGFGPETYMVYNGLNIEDDTVLGDYIARVSRFSSETDTAWTLTTRIHGEIVWVEEEVFESLSTGTEKKCPRLTLVTVDSYVGEEC